MCASFAVAACCIHHGYQRFAQTKTGRHLRQRRSTVIGGEGTAGSLTDSEVQLDSKRASQHQHNNTARSRSQTNGTSRYHRHAGCLTTISANEVSWQKVHLTPNLPLIEALKRSARLSLPGSSHTPLPDSRRIALAAYRGAMRC